MISSQKSLYLLYTVHNTTNANNICKQTLKDMTSSTWSSVVVIDGCWVEFIVGVIDGCSVGFVVVSTVGSVVGAVVGW